MKITQHGFKTGLIAMGLIIGVAGFQSQAAAVTIDFTGLGTSVPLYSEDGFDLTATVPTTFSGASGFLAPGSTITTFTLVESAGGLGAFTMTSIDILQGSTFDPGQVIDFTGTLFGGGTVMQTITTGGPSSGVETFAFDPSFIGLTSLSWTGSPAAFVLYDNIVLNAIDPATTPEPSTMLLFGTGVLGLIGYARRRRDLTV